jgi:hypothetical protein
MESYQFWCGQQGTKTTLIMRENDTITETKEN